MKKTIPANMTLDKNVLEWIDTSRGITKRSSFVNSILAEYMKTQINE